MAPKQKQQSKLAFESVSTSSKSTESRTLLGDENGQNEKKAYSHMIK